MNAPTKSQPPAMQAMLDEMLRIAGDDAHRPGVMEQLAEVMKKAVADPQLLAALRDATGEDPDLYGSMKDPGLGIMGVHSSKIGYREPHDHGACWAINVQVSGKLRLVHWTQDGVDPATGKVRLRKIDEIVMGPGDVDCSPPAWRTSCTRKPTIPSSWPCAAIPWPASSRTATTVTTACTSTGPGARKRQSKRGSSRSSAKPASAPCRPARP